MCGPCLDPLSDKPTVKKALGQSVKIKHGLYKMILRNYYW